MTASTSFAVNAPIQPAANLLHCNRLIVLRRRFFVCASTATDASDTRIKVTNVNIFMFFLPCCIAVRTTFAAVAISECKTTPEARESLTDCRRGECSVSALKVHPKVFHM
jgi:hypothetical protein